LSVEKIFEAAAKISTGWSLAAFAMAAVLLLLWRRADRRLLIAGVVGIVVLGALPIAANLFVERPGRDYRVRVVVLDESGSPTEDAEVWSSLGGEPKKVAGGWEFLVSGRPNDGRITLYATEDSAFLKGSTSLLLAKDRTPTATLKMQRDTSAQVRGIVVDEHGHGLQGAQVSLIGRQAATTDKTGSFVVPAHAADGQQVELHVQTADGRAASFHVQAGDAGVTLAVPGL
jgi:hypothetical protein